MPGNHEAEAGEQDELRSEAVRHHADGYPQSNAWQREQAHQQAGFSVVQMQVADDEADQRRHRLERDGKGGGAQIKDAEGDPTASIFSVERNHGFRIARWRQGDKRENKGQDIDTSYEIATPPACGGMVVRQTLHQSPNDSLWKRINPRSGTCG